MTVKKMGPVHSWHRLFAGADRRRYAASDLLR